jgi:hypothetical protein
MLVAVVAADDPQEHFLGQILRGRRVSGQSREVPVDDRTVMLEQPPGERDRASRFAHIAI